MVLKGQVSILERLRKQLYDQGVIPATTQDNAIPSE